MRRYSGAAGPDNPGLNAPTGRPGPFSRGRVRLNEVTTGHRSRWPLVGLLLSCVLLGGLMTAPPASSASNVRLQGVLNVVHFTNAERTPDKGEELHLSLDSPLGDLTEVRIDIGRTTRIRPARFDDLETLDRRRATVTGTMEEVRPGSVALVSARDIAVGADASLGKGFDISGNPRRAVPLLTVLCRFADQTANQQDQSYFQGLMGSNGLAADFWDELTYGKVTLAGSQVIPPSGSWYTLPGDMADYQLVDDGKTTMDLGKLYADCAGIAAQDVDLDDFGIINLFFNAQLVGYSFGGSWNGRRVTWVPYNHWLQAWIPFHELGHAFKGVHSPFLSEYDNAWDLQSGAQLATQPNPEFGPVPQHSNVWNKDRAGFIPLARKKQIAIQGTTTFTLKSATNPVGSGPIMATIEPDGLHSYIIEFRTAEGYDSALPLGGQPGAVVIHENFDDPDPEGKKRRAVLMGTDGLAGGAWFEGEVFKRWELNTPYPPNHNFDVDGFLIRVDDITATQATVTVTRLQYSLLGKGPRTKTAYTVTWSDLNTAETYFELQYAPVSNPNLTTTLELPPNTTSFTRAGLAAGQDFVHRHRSCNAVGCGPWSPDLVYGTRPLDIGS